MKGRVELITNLVVIAFAAFLVVAFFRSGLGRWARPSGPAQVKAGDQLPAVAGLNLTAGGTTLILAIRDGCHYCEDSVLFYAHLVALRRAGHLKPALFAVLPDDVAVARAFLAAHHVALPFAAGIPLDKLHVRGTPTLIWTDAHRRVLRVCVGEQSAMCGRRLIEVLGGQVPLSAT